MKTLQDLRRENQELHERQCQLENDCDAEYEYMRLMTENLIMQRRNENLQKLLTIAKLARGVTDSITDTLTRKNTKKP